MSSVLKQVAAAIGGLLFFVALGLGLLNGISAVTALFRAFIVMLIGTTVMALFFRFFTSVLFGFIAERMVAQRKAQEAAREAQRNAAGNAPV